MNEKYTLRCGPIERDIFANCFEDASWQAIYNSETLAPFSLTLKRTGQTLMVIGNCPECCTTVWLDDNWFVSAQDGAIFEHCDCYDPGGAAYREMMKNGGGQL